MKLSKHTVAVIDGVIYDTFASGVALVRFRDTGPLAYRCPTSVLFNQDSQQPFTPWPDYVEGISEDLAVAVRDIKAAVEHEASLQPER